MIQKVSENTTAYTSGAGNSNKKETTITPFEKVLEEVSETKKAEDVVVTTNASKKLTSGSKKLDAIFKKAADKYDVPYNFLIAVAKAESNFNVKATSKSGAQGIMQLMPATAKSLGVKDAYDAEENIMAGAKYLGAHLKTFDGDLELAAAAYNAGGAAVKKYGGIPPYEETKNYVKTINKYMKQGVTVPDKTVEVSAASTENAGSTDVENAAKATSEELANSTVVVGTGDSAVTMSYGAYLKYLELGSKGVG